MIRWALLAAMLTSCSVEVPTSSLPDAGVDAEPDVPDAVSCLSNTRPLAPSLTSPQRGRRDVVADELEFTLSAFEDPDGDAFARAEFELWRINGAGVFDELVWRASVSADALGELRTIRLSAGEFEPGILTLDPWRDFAVRVRVVDRDTNLCEQASEFSEPVEFRSDDGSRAFFDGASVHDIRLTLSQETIDALNAQAYPPGCVPFERDYYPGEVTINGVNFPGVGVKTKGGCGSARDFGGKPGLKIDLSWDDPAIEGCGETRRFAGQKSLTLNNMVQDSSHLHERLGYTFYRALGVGVPRANSAQVWVNGEYYGIYLNLETPSRRFLNHRFDHSGGMLYEGTYWCDLYSSNVDTCLTQEFSLGVCDDAPAIGDNPYTYAPLTTLISELDALDAAPSYYPEINAVLDFDTWLSAWAAEAVMSHWDGYNYSIVNNYRVYHDPSTGLWSLIPTGIDQTFSGDADPWGVSGRVARMCLEDRDCEVAFAARLAESVTLFNSLDLPAMATSIHDQLRPLIVANSGRGVGVGEFDGAYNDTMVYLVGRANRVLEHLAAHGF